MSSMHQNRAVYNRTMPGAEKSTQYSLQDDLSQHSTGRTKTDLATANYSSDSYDSSAHSVTHSATHSAARTSTMWGIDNRTDITKTTSKSFKSNR